MGSLFEWKLTFNLCYIKIVAHISLSLSGQVANKLFQLNYISENIERFATQMLLSAVDNHTSDSEHLQSGSSEKRTEGMVGFRIFVIILLTLYLAMKILNRIIGVIFWIIKE